MGRNTAPIPGYATDEVFQYGQSPVSCMSSIFDWVTTAAARWRPGSKIAGVQTPFIFVTRAKKSARRVLHMRSHRITFWGNQIVDSSRALKAGSGSSVNRLFGSFLTPHTGLNGANAKEKETLAHSQRQR